MVEITKEVSSLRIVVEKNNLKQQIPTRAGVIAYVQFENANKTLEVFEKMRDLLVNRGNTKAILYFPNNQTNSYLSLFTAGLSKPNNLTEKQF